jgi:predicted ester cyclase
MAKGLHDIKRPSACTMTVFPGNASILRTGWLALVMIVALMGLPGNAAAAPLRAPMEDDGGSTILPPDLGNQQVAFRLFADVLAGKQYEVCPLLMAATAITHTPAGNFEGPAGFEKHAADAWGAFPDATFVIDESIPGADLVTLRWTMTGRHLDAFGGWSATGAGVRLEGVAILRFEGGMIAETWLQYDRMALVEQMEQSSVMPDVCPPCDLP